MSRTLWVPAALVSDGDEWTFTPEYEALLAIAADMNADVELYDGESHAAIVAAFALCALSGAAVGVAIVAILWWLVG